VIDLFEGSAPPSAGIGTTTENKRPVTAGPLLLESKLATRARGRCVEPKFKLEPGISVVSFIISKNLQRRHLTASQRAMYAADMLPRLEAEARER
jgi:hypothetical protein